jgi:Sap, sulfolipid-1-addressing protein
MNTGHGSKVDCPDHGSPGDQSDGGLLLSLVAFKSWRGRPAAGEEVSMPKWMALSTAFTRPKAGGTAFLLAGISPTNLLLIIGAAQRLHKRGVSGTDQAVARAVFVTIASIGLAAPVGIFFAMGDTAHGTLARPQDVDGNQ